MLKHDDLARPKDRYITDLYSRPDAPMRPRFSPPADAHDYTMPRTKLAPRILLLLVMPVSVVVLGAWAAVELGWF